MNEYSIQALPEEERPRERLLRFGADSLSLVELLAVILGSGTKTMPVLQLAQELVICFGGLKQLTEATLPELLTIKGIGKTKAIQLKAALNLGMRASRQLIKPRFKIEHPLHAYQLIKEQLENETREVFMVILQDTKGYLICCETVSIGSLSQTLVHPREVFYPAIRHKAASLLIAHNHPSGDPAPSPQDLELTRVLLEASQLVGIPLLDHIIIGKETYLSFRQKGLCFL